MAEPANERKRLRGMVVRPISRARAKQLCEDHPHAGTLPNSAKNYMECLINGRTAGLAAWGYGVRPADTPNVLFANGVLGVDEYLELCRFFVYDWVPKSTPSKFLAITHRLIRKHQPQVKVLYTYAAGFQGLVGYIYQASGYDYVGTHEVNSFLWIPGRGLVHAIALWHRYSQSSCNPKRWQHLFPGAKQWLGLNFRYMYWLCDRKERERMMGHARFQVLPYPKDKDLVMWTVDAEGRREDLAIDQARAVAIVKLSSTRAKNRGTRTAHAAP